MSENTVTFEQLCKDRCNFTDKAFEAAVSNFMNRMMPGFPMGLLDTTNFERWQVEPEDRYTVARLHFLVYTCHDCGEEYPRKLGAKEPEVCCLLEAIAEQGEEEPELFECGERKWLALKDTHYSDTFAEMAGDSPIDLPNGETIWCWEPDEEDEARQKAAELNSESMNESMHGFPWASGWGFLPDDYVDTQTLEAAGFTVATYVGGQGNWRDDPEYRICGIDGGGYSFKGAHFATLYFAHQLKHGWRVETDNGPATPVEEEDE